MIIREVPKEYRDLDILLLDWFYTLEEKKERKFIDSLIIHPAELQDKQHFYNPIHVYCRLIDAYQIKGTKAFSFINYIYEDKIKPHLYKNMEVK